MLCRPKDLPAAFLRAGCHIDGRRRHARGGSCKAHRHSADKLHGETVFEREAGYRQRHDYSYTPCPHLPDDKPIHGCFQMPCSTVYPCYPKYLRKYSDKEEMELLLNRKCINKFR